MPDEQDQKAGTQDAAAVNGEEPNESARTDGGDAGAERGGSPTNEDWRALYLKGLERQKAQDDEIERLREQSTRAAQSVPPAVPDSREQQEAARLAELAQAVTETQWLAQYASDPDQRRQAKVNLLSLETALRTQQSTVNELAFARMDAKDQTEARKEFASGQYANPDAALLAVQGRRYMTERERLDKEKAEVEAAKQRQRTGTDTFVQSATAKQLAEKRMPHSQWVREVQAARAAKNQTRVRELYAIEDAGGITNDA